MLIAGGTSACHHAESASVESGAAVLRAAPAAHLYEGQPPEPLCVIWSAKEHATTLITRMCADHRTGFWQSLIAQAAAGLCKPLRPQPSKVHDLYSLAVNL